MRFFSQFHQSNLSKTLNLFSFNSTTKSFSKFWLNFDVLDDIRKCWTSKIKFKISKKRIETNFLFEFDTQSNDLELKAIFLYRKLHFLSLGKFIEYFEPYCLWSFVVLIDYRCVRRHSKMLNISENSKIVSYRHAAFCLNLNHNWPFNFLLCKWWCDVTLQSKTVNLHPHKKTFSYTKCL